MAPEAKPLAVLALSVTLFALLSVILLETLLMVLFAVLSVTLLETLLETLFTLLSVTLFMLHSAACAHHSSKVRVAIEESSKSSSGICALYAR